MGITLCCIDYSSKKKIPEKFAVSIIDNFLEMEKNFKNYEQQFQKIFN